VIVLVVESSTTSAKAMLVSTDSPDVLIRSRRFDGAAGGSVTRDAEAVFRQTARLARSVAAGHPVDLVVLSSTWHGVLLCDRDGQPVSPAYEWPFTGGGAICADRRADPGYVDWFYERTGCMVNAIYPAFKLPFLAGAGHDLSRALVLDQGSYTFFRLTGQLRTMHSMASGTGMYNIHTQEMDGEILAETGLRGDQFPRLAEHTYTAGLTQDAADLLGVGAGVPVMTAAPDGGLCQIGDRAMDPGVMTLSMGTSGALRVTTSKPVLSDRRQTWCYRSPLAWLSGAATSGCCNCVDWAVARLFPGGTTYAEIESGLSPAPERTPVFLPFLFGERCPGWDDRRRATFAAVEPEHTASDLYHAVLEGTLFNLYQCYRELSALNGVPRQIRLSGGVTNSAVWTQMCADVFGVGMEISPLQHSSLVGGAVLGLEWMGAATDHPALAPRVSATVVADPATHERYAAKFAVYEHHYAHSAALESTP
jgi:gluconokinase